MEGEGSVESDSSDSLLSKAIAASGVAPEQAAAAPIVAAAAPIVVARKDWRKRMKQVSLRKRGVREGVLKSVSARLGRVVKPRLTADRKRQGRDAGAHKPKHGSFKAELVRELAFGGVDDSTLIAGMKRCEIQSVACGLHNKCGRRARAPVLDMLSRKVENDLKAEAAKAHREGGGDFAAPRAWHAKKICWDETAMEFHCPLDVVKAACPGLAFEPRKIEVPVKHRRPREVAAVAASSARDGALSAPMEPETQQVDANARPVYVVQVMQVGGSIQVGDRDAEYINRPSICESTTAQHLHKTLEPWVRADVLTSAQRDGDHCFGHVWRQSRGKQTRDHTSGVCNPGCKYTAA